MDTPRHGFENLEVWKRGCRLAVALHGAMKTGKDFCFRDQIWRSALSIPSNIAEGYERKSPKDFIRFLVIAKGSCGELRTQLYIAQQVGFLNKKHCQDYIGETQEISAMLSGLIKTIQHKHSIN
ncbi:four helix bundle protein [Desulfoplanes formicivorans]|uniref:23S rRNA-associated protein n=1 Tax=Desulfoplanes formicivorans TaxID=1592317 RepID=A0A194AIC7_9BACT|nr:23S rRNA-associated protein [Desulfoplanes formicivorans]